MNGEKKKRFTFQYAQARPIGECLFLVTSCSGDPGLLLGCGILLRGIIFNFQTGKRPFLFEMVMYYNLWGQGDGIFLKTCFWMLREQAEMCCRIASQGITIFHCQVSPGQPWSAHSIWWQPLGSVTAVESLWIFENLNFLSQLTHKLDRLT